MPRKQSDEAKKMVTDFNSERFRRNVESLAGKMQTLQRDLRASTELPAKVERHVKGRGPPVLKGKANESESGTESTIPNREIPVSDGGRVQ